MRVLRNSRAVADVGAPTAAFLAAGASGFALLAAGPRLLGATEYALLAVAWTIVQAIAIGLAAPSEQTVNKAVASGVGEVVASRVRTRLLWAGLASALLPLAGALHGDPVFKGSQLWAWAVVLSVFGWVLAAPSRGRLAGRGAFFAYSGSIWVEAGVRLLLVLGGWLFVGQAQWFLSAALWLPMWLSAAAAHWLARRPSRFTPRGSDATDTSLAEALSHQGRFTIVAVAAQVSLGVGTVWLQVNEPDNGSAGVYVSATTYMRIPVILVGGLALVVLSSVSSAISRGQPRRARDIVVTSVASTALLGVTSTGLLWVISGPALQLYYGQPLDLSPVTLGLMAAATVATMLAGILTQAVFAGGMSRFAAAVWAGAAALSVAGTLAAGESFALLAGAVLISQSFAAVVLAVGLFGWPGFGRSATTSI